MFDDLVDDLSSRMCVSSSLCVVFKQCFAISISVIVTDTDTDRHSMTSIR